MIVALLATALLAAPPSARVLQLLEAGEAKMNEAPPKVQLAGAKLKEKAFELAPNHFETATGMCHAVFVRSFFAKDPKKGAKLARKAVRLAKKVVARWPDRAEGHYWIAVNTGILARHIGFVEALSQGLAGIIERAALKALELDRTIYKGAVPRMLGRYYFLVPWPLRNDEKANSLLEEAHEADPTNVTGMLFLADVYEREGDMDRAISWFEKCAASRGPDPDAPKTCAARLEELGRGSN